MKDNEIISGIRERRESFAEKKGDWKAAGKLYDELKHAYPNSYEAMDVEKRIEYVNAKASK